MFVAKKLGPARFIQFVSTAAIEVETQALQL